MTAHIWALVQRPDGRPMSQRQCRNCAVWETAYSRKTDCPQPEMTFPGYDDEDDS